MNGEGFAFFRWHTLKWDRFFCCGNVYCGRLKQRYEFEKMVAEVYNRAFDEKKETL